MSDNNHYGLSPAKTTTEIDAPPIDYRPPSPQQRDRPIGVIGIGGISQSHLQAYHKAGLNVVALVDRTLDKAIRMRDRYFPAADVMADYRQLLDRDDVEVIDATPHPLDRLPILRDAIESGKHVLSQKPFVLNLDDGERLVELAEKHKVQLAVNQNGRWAPHFAYIRESIHSGLIGDVVSVDFSLQWDQTWIAGIEALEEIKHLVLFDFGIHWFDIATCFMQGRQPIDVFAQTVHQQNQKYRPAALASAVIRYADAQVRMSFNGHTLFGEQDTTTVVGTKGTLRSTGPGLNNQSKMEVHLDTGCRQVPLHGCWFEEGFQGSMCELLRAIESSTVPSNNARESSITSTLFRGDAQCR
ncbi:MAG: Gfo/Idh/MocA family oxidoreductase [Pirellulaceae bacterium]